jgi:hypothetical protein
MLKKFCMVGLAAASFAAPAAFAASMPAGGIAGYLVSEELEEADGTGFGIKGWASLNGPWFVHGEYQAVTVENGPFELDVNQLRFGAGFAGDMGNGMMWMGKVEYIDFGSDTDQAGFGAHGGLMFNVGQPLSGFVSLGYLTTDDTDGLEFDVGGKYSFTKDWAGFVDYRSYMGSVDPDGDFELTDLRIGAAYSFY